MEALIDLDLVCFRSAASAENEELGIAIYRANELLDRILDKVGTSDYRAFLTGDTNFRKEILPTYKANRTAPKPRHLKELRKYAMLEMKAELAPEGLEADDSLAIHQTDDTIICTLDKDLLQVPGKHFSWSISGKNWKRPDTFFQQDELGGARLFFEQCLKGDVSDNVKGIKNIGEKKSKQMLSSMETEQDMFELVQDMYSDDNRFIKNASCLWIRRTEDDIWKDRFNAYIQK